MNILVTGGAGFIGGNFIRYVLTRNLDNAILNLDLLTYAGNPNSLKDVANNPKYAFVRGNITDKELVMRLVKEYDIDAIVNFAAETHVDRSILSPSVFAETNIQGTLTLLEVAKECSIGKFIQVSTDEVYGSLGDEGHFTEETPLAPNSPYSASKASADLLVRAYHETFGMNVNITRCSNNYGPYHFPEKLIPLLVTNGLDGLDLPIYGDGGNVRDWLHVSDHCAAIDLVLKSGKPGEVYNVGGHNERTNNEIAEIIAARLNLPKGRIKHVADRPGHDRRYAIDPSKLETELGWVPQFTFDTGIVETIEWYVNNESWWRPLKKCAKLGAF